MGLGKKKKSTEKGGIQLGFEPGTFQMLADDQDTYNNTGQRTRPIPADFLSYS